MMWISEPIRTVVAWRRMRRDSPRSRMANTVLSILRARERPVIEGPLARRRLERARRRRRSAQIVAGSLILALFIGGGVAGARYLGPQPHGWVAVAFPPWVSEPDAVARIERAGAVAAAVGDGVFRYAAIGAGPEFLGRLAEDGAILAVDGARLRDVARRMGVLGRVFIDLAG